MAQVSTGIGHMVHTTMGYPVGNKPRSGFRMPNSVLTAFDGGYLIPIWNRFAYPGDTLDMRVSAFIRMTTQIVPFFTPLYMDIHVWCVPARLVWKHWKNFMGERKNPRDSIDYLTPQLTTPSAGVGFSTTYDYNGVRPGVGGIKFNVGRFRSQALTFNEWYRDENLTDEVPFTDEDSGDTIDDYYLYKRRKRKTDPITSGLPFTQKGTAVNLPIGLSAPVIGDGNALGLTNGTSPYFTLSTRTGDAYNFAQLSGNGTTAPVSVGSIGTNLGIPPINANIGVSTDSSLSGLRADLSQAEGITINQLYDSIAIQQVLQADALHGSRYIEMILGSFGVKSSDARMQRPEFLGGAHFTMDMQVVPQTSSTNTTTPQGNLSANGTFSGVSKHIIKSFEEHCYLFAYANVRVPYYYQYGMEEDFFRHSRFDFYRPELANITEKATLMRNVYVQGTAQDEEVFNYNEAWVDMRMNYNRITGIMRSDAPGSLDFWHLAEKRNTPPAFNDEWISESTDIYNRVLAVNAEQGSNIKQFFGEFAFDEKWYRVMPIYSIPGIQPRGGLL